MTILESHRVLIGACGWLHEHWQDHFYPEDLPRDWLLGYYGNEYPVVMIRDKEWQQGGSVKEWLEESDEIPVFICDLPLQDLNKNLVEHAEEYLSAARELGERCIGIVCSVSNTVDVQELKNLLQQCQSIAPTVLSMPDPTSQVNALIKEININPLWDSCNDNQNNQGNLYVARLDSSKNKLPELRTAMENLLAMQSGQNTLVLLIGGEKPDIELIKQAKVMLDLL